MEQVDKLTVLLWPEDDGPPGRSSLDDALALPVGARLTWIDLRSPGEAMLGRLAAHYALHPLAVRRSLTGRHYGSVRLFENHAYLIWTVAGQESHRPAPFSGRATDPRQPLNVFLGEKVLITTHQSAVTVIDDVRDELLAGRQAVQGAGWLLHQILERSVEDYHRLLDAINEQADRLESAMLGDPRQKELESLLSVKNRLLALRKTVGPERDALNFLENMQGELMPQELRLYFQDLHSSLLTLIDDVDTTRDIINGSMDIYLSAVSNRLSEIMKRLTVVATVVLPATLITSFFGMNNLPLGWRNGTEPWLGSLSFVLGSLFMIGLGVWLWMYSKRQGWW